MHVMGLRTIVIAIFVVYESIVYKAKDGKGLCYGSQGAIHFRPTHLSTDSYT